MELFLFDSVATSKMFQKRTLCVVFLTNTTIGETALKTFSHPVLSCPVLGWEKDHAVGASALQKGANK